MTASDAGKLALYLHSLLAELGLNHDDAILLYKDSADVFMMVDSEKPTQQMRHINIQHFALLNWVERDLVRLEKISTKLNTADILTKSTPCIIFHCHNNIIIGKLSPQSFELVCTAYAVR